MIKIKHKNHPNTLKIAITWEKNCGLIYKLILKHTVSQEEYIFDLFDVSNKKYEICSTIDMSDLQEGEYIGRITDGNHSDDVLLILGETYKSKKKEYNNNEDNLIYEYEEK